MFFNPAPVPKDIRYRNDKAIIFNLAVKSLEKELEKARKIRGRAKDKLKKADRSALSPKQHAKYRNDYHLACQQYDAWERRLEITRNLAEVE